MNNYDNNMYNYASIITKRALYAEYAHIIGMKSRPSNPPHKAIA